MWYELCYLQTMEESFFKKIVNSVILICKEVSRKPVNASPLVLD